MLSHNFKNGSAYVFFRRLKFFTSLCFSYCKNFKLVKSFKNVNFYDFTNQQNRLLSDILNYSKNNIPYYGSLIKNQQINELNSVETLGKLPLLSKEIIRKEKSNMFPVNFNSVNYSNWKNTGGSTGEPLKFPMTENLEPLHQLCLYNLMRVRFSDLVVSFDGTRIDSEMLKRNIFWIENKFFDMYGKFHFSSLYLDDSNANFYISKLNEIKPSVFRGYPSLILKLAKYVELNSVELNFNLKGIYLTSEFFDHEMMHFIGKIFNCHVFGQYGQTEATVFAFTQKNKLEYYCSPLYGYTEVLNEDGSHVSTNEIGEVVVTGFYNKCMPFIRYKTGDIAVYGGAKNGFVKLKS